MPGKVWSKRELRMMKFFYFEEKLSVPEIAELIDGRSISQIRHKIYTLGWGRLRKAKDELAKTAQLDTMATGNKTFLAKKEGNALTEGFVAEVSTRAAAATTKAFESYEHEASKEKVDDRDVHKMETAMKIAERASEMARRNLGLDKPGSSGGGNSVFNVYYSEGVVIKKVTPDEESDSGEGIEEGTIDV